MHYPDESYVRQYTRKTSTNRMLKWQGRAVMHAMLGEFDRAGIFELAGDAVECISAVTDIPEEIVRFGLERLIATRTWTVTSAAIVWPTYVEAQTCAKSDRMRQQESRKRRALEAAAAGEESQADERPESRAVTPGHAPSRNVTPSLSDPSLTKPISLLPEEGEIDSNEPRPPAREPMPAPARSGRLWPSFPKGWRGWSLETTKEAVAQGLMTADLAGHVDYWALRAFPGGPVNDLDGELRRSIPGIVKRKHKAGAASSAGTTSAAPNPHAFAPSAEHISLAKERDLPLQDAVAAYRASGIPDKLGSFRARDDFSARLRWWAEHGGDFPLGKPRRRGEASGGSEQRTAVGA